MPALGAYGLRLSGVEEAASRLVPADDTWPRYELVARRGDVVSPSPDRVGATTAELTLRSAVRVAVERERRMVFTASRRLRAEELIHPLLAAPAAAAARWAGRDSLHAGAFVASGGTCVLLGERGSGKTSLLAALAGSGSAVVCDDMLVLEELTPLVGPRTLDLRADAAERFGPVASIGVAGTRERFRLSLAPIAHPPRVTTVVHLAWSDEGSVALERVPPAQRLGRLLEHVALRLPPVNAELPLELAALGTWELKRPRDWAQLDTVVERLVDVVA